MIPYGRQQVEADDIAAVVDVLKSDWLTTGPQVEAFERAVSDFTGAGQAVAVSNGTAALHCAMSALKLGPGDEVIVPSITFVATANAVIYQGATPLFADVDPDTLLIDPASVASLVTANTVAVIAVDYAGQPCDYSALRKICDQHHLVLVADAAHSLGAEEGGRPVGVLADLTTFSFHPVKGITTAEGGMVVTDNADYAQHIRSFRNHGLNMDLHERRKAGALSYRLTGPGHNYRLSDIQCALGVSQLPKLRGWVERRREVAQHYQQVLSSQVGIEMLRCREGVLHAHHLFVIKVDRHLYGMGRDDLFRNMREQGIGVNVHYPPLHLQPFYQAHCGAQAGQCPQAEALFGQILSLPIYPALSADDISRVTDAVARFSG